MEIHSALLVNVNGVMRSPHLAVLVQETMKMKLFSVEDAAGVGQGSFPMIVGKLSINMSAATDYVDNSWR